MDDRSNSEMNSEQDTNSNGTENSQDADYIRIHDRVVLEFLSQKPSSLIGFQGLKRRLGLHPEQLSRALHRLSSDGLVEQTDLGYRVTRKGLTILSMEEVTEERPGVTVLQTFMPRDLDTRDVVAILKGSWIGPLRWQGLAESDDGLQMSWITEDDKVQLDARIHGGQLMITARIDYQERVDEAIRLGHLLFQHISRASTEHGEPSSVSA